MSTDHAIKLTSFSHGGGCGCKIAPGVLSEILKGASKLPVPKELMVGIETADDAAVYRLNADTGRAAQFLGYRAETAFEDGLRRYVDWFRDRHTDVAGLLETDIENWTMPAAGKRQR